MPESSDSDPKVRDLLDAATQADLERWFGLPSFTQLAEAEERKPPPAPDPETIADQERRAATLAAVDPAVVDAHFRRRDLPAEAVTVFHATLKQEEERTIVLLDESMIERRHQLAEPREYELSHEMKSDLNECTPQAILRDLHRPEVDFQKHFVIDESGAVEPFQGTAIVAELMATRWGTPAIVSPPREWRATRRELRRELREPAESIFAKLNNHKADRRKAE